MDKQSEDSSDNFPANHDLAKDNQMFQALIQPRQSQPTKNKVKNFKNRIFGLLMIYADKCDNVNTLLSCLKQEMFIREPQKMRQLVNTILNKQNITFQMLQQLGQHYKVMLLFKAKKGTNQLAEDFVRIIKKIATHQQNNSQQILKDMLKSFAYKRKCKIHADFFFYFLRKIPSLKPSLIQECNTILKDVSLRPAQKKQVQKLKLKLLKKYSSNQSVKKQQSLIKSESKEKSKVQKDKKNISKEASNKKIPHQKLTSSMKVNSNNATNDKNQNFMVAQQKKNAQFKMSYKKDARKKNKKDKKTHNINKSEQRPNISSPDIQKKENSSIKKKDHKQNSSQQNKPRISNTNPKKHGDKIKND